MENDLPQLKKRKMSPVTDSEALITPEPQLLVKRLSKNAKLPTRGSALAAGYDLYRCVNRLDIGRI
jgi:dUTP pyrophosphatase